MIQPIELKYLFILEATAMLSSCKDKKAACLAVLNGEIRGLGINQPYKCNGLCDHTCSARHAESQCWMPAGCTVYLNLYPCEQCQRMMHTLGVKEVVVFGTQHKANVGVIQIRTVDVPFDFLKKYNAPKEQECVAAGEAGELIAALMDTRRSDKKEHYGDVPAEMVDMLIQLFLLNKYNIHEEWNYKINKLIAKYEDGGFNASN